MNWEIYFKIIRATKVRKKSETKKQLYQIVVFEMCVRLRLTVLKFVLQFEIFIKV